MSHPDETWPVLIVRSPVVWVWVWVFFFFSLSISQEMDPHQV